MDKIRIIGVSGKRDDVPVLTKEQLQVILDNASEIAKAVNEAYLESERNHSKPLASFRKS